MTLGKIFFRKDRINIIRGSGTPKTVKSMRKNCAKSILENVVQQGGKMMSKVWIEIDVKSMEVK